MDVASIARDWPTIPITPMTCGESGCRSLTAVAMVWGTGLNDNGLPVIVGSGICESHRLEINSRRRHGTMVTWRSQHKGYT